MGNRYGRYEVMYKLGQGAMAQVYLARDPVLSRFVAIKVLHAELATRQDVLQRFFNEARTVAVIRNPHVVDFGKEGQDLYLVMEFVDGQSLHGILNQLRIPSVKVPQGAGSTEIAEDYPPGQMRDHLLHSEPMDPKVAAALICQAAEGLSVAAQHGVVHRDIKPENLMINQQGYLKISDFGIAHVQDDNLTKTGAILGSPLYMSPEQARGLKPITSQADMFSLGSVFYTCLAGHPPFKGKSFTELFRKIACDPPTPLWRLRPELDPVLVNLVDALLQKDPRHRGEGPKWLHRQLKGYLMAAGIGDPAEFVGNYLRDLSAQGVQTTWRSDGPPTILSRTRKTIRFTREGKRKRPVGAWVAAGLALSLVSGGLWYGKYGKNHLARPNALSADSKATSRAAAASTAKLGNTSDTLAGMGAANPGGNPMVLAASVDSNSAATPAPAQILVKPISAVPVREIPGSLPKPPAKSAESPTAATEEATALVLQSSPPFAEAFLDGRFVGVTPVELDQLASGRHRVVMKGKNASTLDTMVAVRSGSQTMKFKLDEGQAPRLAGGQDDQP